MIRKILPKFIFNSLFGNRDFYKTKIIENDLDWLKWQKLYKEFYFNSYKSSISYYVNNLGHQIIKELDFQNKTVLELGPGQLPHLTYWKNHPNNFIAIDTNLEFLNITKNKLGKICKIKQIKTGDSLPVKSNSVDIILTFYSLEHIFDLKMMLKEFLRVLKKDGILVGAIPNEGGLAWGLGRYFTTRRYVKRVTNVNYNKVICWEHPNFADYILKQLEMSGFQEHKIKMLPFTFHNLIDFNLITSFIYKKKQDY